MNDLSSDAYNNNRLYSLGRQPPTQRSCVGDDATLANAHATKALSEQGTYNSNADFGIDMLPVLYAYYTDYRLVVIMSVTTREGRSQTGRRQECAIGIGSIPRECTRAGTVRSPCTVNEVQWAEREGGKWLRLMQGQLDTLHQ